jgi:hypothetical protein
VCVQEGCFFPCKMTCSGLEAGGDVISAYVWGLCLEGLCSRRRWVEWEHSRYMVIDAWEDDEEAS